MKNNWLCVHIAALEPGDEPDELFIRGYLAAKNEALALAERAEREAPPDLAVALERLVKEWRQPLEVESPLQGAFKKHYEYQRRKCADELAAQLKVQR